MNVKGGDVEFKRGPWDEGVDCWDEKDEINLNDLLWSWRDFLGDWFGDVFVGWSRAGKSGWPQFKFRYKGFTVMVLKNCLRVSPIGDPYEVGVCELDGFVDGGRKKWFVDEVCEEMMRDAVEVVGSFVSFLQLESNYVIRPRVDDEPEWVVDGWGKYRKHAKINAPNGVQRPLKKNGELFQLPYSFWIDISEGGELEMDDEGMKAVESAVRTTGEGGPLSKEDKKDLLEKLEEVKDGDGSEELLSEIEALKESVRELASTQGKLVSAIDGSTGSDEGHEKDRKPSPEVAC